MRFLEIKKIHAGQYLHRYDVSYVNQTGELQRYEMVSRRGNLDSLEKLNTHQPDAVVMVIRDEQDEHMLLIREYRMELGRTIYGLPGGLIEQGESAEECAGRELQEETGLELYKVERCYPPAACTVGIGDEQTVCVFGRAAGNLRSLFRDAEEITAGWYSRKEILAMQETELFGSWALAYSRIWAEDPFGRR